MKQSVLPSSLFLHLSFFWFFWDSIPVQSWLSWNLLWRPSRPPEMPLPLSTSAGIRGVHHHCLAYSFFLSMLVIHKQSKNCPPLSYNTSYCFFFIPPKFLFLLKFFFFFFNFRCFACILLYIMLCIVLQKKWEEYTGYPGSGVTESHELPNIRARNWAWIFCKSIKYF